MDFFEHQDVARKKTGQLVLLFCLAVVSIGLILYAVGVVASGYLMADRETGAWAIEWVNPLAALFSVTLLLLIVGGGTMYKLVQLRAGGQVVARSLGGRLLSRDTNDAGERRLLNIVEEMALASGTPVPPVYVMDDERGLNAFAAGYSPSSAVIGVTRGAIDHFSRAEMQGVMAHEFSHILNGDMRLNIRLMGVIHGILLLGIVGSMIIRSFFYGSMMSGGRSRGGRKDSGGGQIVIVVLVVGGVLIVLGAVGTFFGTLIKSAVSRQREFLADASAVQFTRDPQTIAGALRSIGGYKHRARIVSPHAPEASHLFFAQAITSGFSSVFATHPPLTDRIKRVDPSWDGTFPQVDEAAYPEVRSGDRRAGQGPGGEDRTSLERLQDVLPIGAAGAVGGAAGAAVQGAIAASVLESIGRIDEAHVEHARGLLTSIPEPIREATNDAFSARAVIFGLLLHDDGPERKKQLDRLKSSADPAVVRALARILPSFEGVGPELRLPILDIATPALAAMTADQAVTFIDNARALAEADEKIEPFEWALLRIVERRLRSMLGNERRSRVDYYAMHKITDDVSVLLSAVARAGHAALESQRLAFDHAAQQLRVPGLAFKNESDSGLDRLGSALETLTRMAPRLKKQVLAASAVCISADRMVTPNEAELFRVIGDELDVPVPPLMPGQKLA